MIIKATLSDAETIAGLAVRMWTKHTPQELAADFSALLQKPDAAVFLYTVQGRAVGFAQCQLRHDYVEGTDSSPVGYLEGIFVETEHRGQGCARALLAACEQWAESCGCTEFASDCELDNTASLRFHRRMGFEEANRIICFTKALGGGVQDERKNTL